MARSPPTQSLGLSAAALIPATFSLVAISPAVQWGWLDASHSKSLQAVLRMDDLFPGLLPSIGFSIAAYFATVVAVGACRETFGQRGFQGRDLLKPKVKEAIPETLGLPASCIYLLVLFLFIPFRYYVVPEGVGGLNPRTTNDGGWFGDLGGRRGFPHHELAVYLSALLSLLSSLVLGFCDDVFDIRWRFKMPIPIVASIPMLLVYYAGQGGTGLVVPGWPAWLRTAVGANVVDLGLLYYLFISLLSTFCTHSINILAGINGVEVGQALIIASSLCLNDFLYLPIRLALSEHYLSPSHPIASPSSLQSELVGRHLFSLSLMLPLVGTCAGLLAWNRHPALVFVGDTFCYFAGQALACAGVLGHFSKTLLLFFLPQVFNFLLSCPQLFGFVPCPRHRVPKVHSETMALYPSLVVFPRGSKRPLKMMGKGMLLILETLRFIKIYRARDLGAGAESGRDGNDIVAATNLTLLNTILVVAGVQVPLEDVKWRLASESLASPVEQPSIPSPQGPYIDEARLWRMTMGVQLLGSAVAFGVRYWAAAIVFPQT
ncbi:hypothetical protein BDZ90DRAFT_231410 [Jaminaea rosea]|uniref:UDP-N-acetylglucosamine--dolichyl-phosphate N-acetylglucosaminephosphotransferase n=1 Tax=Jaminaea rosea TaxID=1569628 RepID=A0A316UTW1_9BASI|nr:hypothetical protein BDZ90DRAFT_231410 [Jaminaea rosea]PWN28434.1 hypothetical protein BDZ90DRAFT_231410 [Jaminaea rosea]